MIEYYTYELMPWQSPMPGDGPEMCIWIHTDAGDYFLEHNAYLSDNPLVKEFPYDFFNLKEFARKYG